MITTFAKKGALPQTQNVRGSNYVQIDVYADRVENRAIVISVLDNVVKGSAAGDPEHEPDARFCRDHGS